MKDFSAFLDLRRYKNWPQKTSSWEYLTTWRPVLLGFSPNPEQKAAFLLSTLNSIQEALKVTSCRSRRYNPCRGRRQVPMDGKYQFVVGTSICKTRYIKLCSERKIEMKYKKKIICLLLTETASTFSSAWLILKIKLLPNSRPYLRTFAFKKSVTVSSFSAHLRCKHFLSLFSFLPIIQTRVVFHNDLRDFPLKCIIKGDSIHNELKRWGS